MATILDVAKLADVSIATVSRVINGDRAVRPRTRRLVEAAIEELDYRPNAAARSLRLAKSQTLGLIITELGNPVYVDVVHGIEAITRAHGYSLFLCDAANDRSQAERHLERLYERRVDGVILYLPYDPPPALSLFRNADVPVVIMGRGAWRPDLVGVRVNERPATTEAMRRLVDLGHRRFVFIAKDSTGGLATYRAGPAQAVLSEAGIEWSPDLVLDSASGDQCRQELVERLQKPDRPTAVVVGTHAYTPFVLDAIHQVGLRVPDDVSVFAYGDSPWLLSYRPPLSVVRIDYEAWGRETATLLLRQMEAPSERPDAIRVAEFIDRGSIGPAPILAGS